MDELLTAALGSLPELGGLGGLGLLVILLLRREAGAEQRHGAEMTRQAAMHDAELAEVRVERDKQRVRIELLEQQLEEARTARWSLLPPPPGPGSSGRHHGPGAP